jgi:2-haloacid dehalogenase
MSLHVESIRAVVFDAYGTLFDVSSIDAFVQKKTGLEKAPALTRLWRAKQLEYSWLRSLMGQYKDFYSLTEDALRYACQALRLNLSDEVIRDCMRQYYHLKGYPGVATALKQLHKSYTLAVLSNANPSLLEKALAYNDIDQYFAEIISADQLGIYKPSPSVYQLATQNLQLEAQQILFLSSNPWDIAGASAYGLHTCWINRNGEVMDYLDSPATLSVQSLEEVVPFVLSV